MDAKPLSSHLEGDVPVLRVAPSNAWRLLDLRELWHFRELVYFLTWRDVMVRYKQTAVGVAWVVLQPLSMVFVFTLFFGRLAKIPSEGVPYPLFAFAALLPWQVFSRAITESAGSLVSDQRLISRVYFPRLIVPTATVLAALVDFVVTFALFVGFMLWYGRLPDYHIIFLPFFLLMMIMTALGTGYWLSALNIEYRDVVYIVPFLNQFWLFITPVVYPASLVPPKWQFLYGLNPMAGVIDGFRWSLLGVGPGPSPMLFASVGVTLFILSAGFSGSAIESVLLPMLWARAGAEIIMSDIAIRVEGLGKRFTLNADGGVRYKALRDNIAGLFSPRSRGAKKGKSAEFWGLKDLTFEIKRGEVVGLIGRNGAGKSTLLKVLSRITEPTEGYAEIHGRVGSLLEVGTGFHPELTGRENIFLNGAILGMRNKEIIRKFDEIVAFAEVERFIDSPVKFYSSGMFVRLAFAVAAHLEPEILFVDEVLAVGDAAFQKKCLGKMDDVARSGRTVVLVSHNMGAISELCTHGILLSGGRLSFIGDVQKAVEGYGRAIAESSHNADLQIHPNLPVSIFGARMMNGEGQASATFDINDQIAIEFDYAVSEPQHGLQLSATVSRNYMDLFRTFDTDGHEVPPKTGVGRYRAKMSIPKRFLKGGHYSVSINAGTPQAVLQNIDGVLAFDVEELSENTHTRGYRQDRPGQLIFPGTWETSRLT